MKKGSLFAGMIFGLVIAGCLHVPQSKPTSAPPRESPTAAKELAPAFTPTIAAAPDVTDSCIGQRGELPSGIQGKFVLTGSWYLYRPELQLSHLPTYIEEPAGAARLQLPYTDDPNTSGFLVSPNRQHIAYLTFNKSDLRLGKLIIVDTTGNPVIEHEFRLWFNLVDWISDSYLLASQLASAYPPFPTIVYDRQANSEQVLPLQYADFDQELHLVGWDAYIDTRAAYSPDLRYVVYPTQNARKIVLLDRVSHKAIIEVATDGTPAGRPVWLAGNRHFVIALTPSASQRYWMQDELFSVSVEGEVHQLTHLSKPDAQDSIYKYRESTDGRYLAFWYNVGGHAARLVVLDNATSRTKVFCPMTGGNLPPVWSPSGHQLLIDGYFGSIDDYGTLFVDVDSGLVAEVEKGLVPVGWLEDK